MLLLLSAPHSAAAGPIYIGSVVDALGDSIGPDIVFTGIVVDDSWITFTMRFAPGTLDSATTKSTFNLDADQNSATGEFWSVLGVDFVAGQGYLGDTGTASLTQYSGGPPALLASVPVSFLADQVEYSFARSLFGAEDGSLDFIAVVQTALSGNSATFIRDYAPGIDRGAGPASTTAVPEPATFAMLAGGLSVLSAYRKRGSRRIPRA
jgi:hypothetical protein